MNQTDEVFMVYFRRTAFSRSRPNDPEKDVYNPIRMDEALGLLIKDSVSSTGVKAEEINDVITGCAIQADENWLYGGRHPVFMANLPFNVPSMSLDRACSSSLNAMSIGAMEIMTGNADIVLAGGMEHMTHVPLSNNPNVKPNIKLIVRPEFAKYDMTTSYNMGLTAEKLAKVKGINRSEMDQFSAESHRKASNAQENGYFKDEILPLEVESGGDFITIDKDQSIRPGTSVDTLSRLPPAFVKDGIITAGNSSPLNAGAALVMLMSGRKLKEYGLKPMAKIKGFSWAAVDPTIMGLGPVPASQKLASKNGMKTEDIDLWEINEAFAVVALNAIKDMSLDPSTVNINGGAIAIGHPLGASGARIAGTLARELNQKQKDHGIATLCVGGGQGYSMMLERV
ncbi:MAG: acetyl-CoA C-acetyltransferase [Candidatus Thermoplasmatota archaeon]|nr:acetyl-CoA C-acetyltransferase [Candidatus Thermoplasmatota archaeon]MDA8143580.1 acetyl-CoA C-acetyltransferase [Thermoplasmatales archaeon]